MEQKRLYRSRTDRPISGVSGGLAEYFDMDPLLIRLVFIILTIAGFGIPIYIILWIVTPNNPVRIIPNRNQPDQTSGQPAPDPAVYTAETSYTTSEPFHSTSESAGPETTYSNTPSKPPVKKSKKGNLTGGLVLIALGLMFLAIELVPQITFGNAWPVVLIVIGISLLVNAVAQRNHQTNQY